MKEEAKAKKLEDDKYRIAYMSYFFDKYGFCAWCSTFVWPKLRANIWHTIFFNVGNSIGVFLVARFLSDKIAALVA